MKYVKIDTDIANEAWVNDPNCIAVVVYLALRSSEDGEGHMQYEASLAAMHKDLGISRDALKHALARLESSGSIVRINSSSGRNGKVAFRLGGHARLENDETSIFCTLNQHFTQFSTQFSTQFFSTISGVNDILLNGCFSDSYKLLSKNNKEFVDTISTQFSTQFSTQLNFYTQFSTQFFSTISDKISEYVKYCVLEDCKSASEVLNIDKSTIYNKFYTQLSTLQRDKEEKKKKEKETREESLSPCIPFDKEENKEKDKEKEKEETEKAYRRNIIYKTRTRENFVEEEKESSVFRPPTLEEIREHFAQKGYPEEAERFYYFYESKGWFVGKTKMKKWKMAAAGWITRTVNPPRGGYQRRSPEGNADTNIINNNGNGQQQWRQPTPSRQQLANEKLGRELAQRCAELLSEDERQRSGSR